MKKARVNLSKQIALMVVLLVLVISIGLGFTALNFSTNVIVDQAEEALLLLAKEGVLRIEAVIDKELGVLQEMANRDVIKGMDWESQRNALALDIERLGYLDMGIVTPDGIVRYVLNNETADLSERDYIKKAFEGKASISDVLISKVTNKPVVMYAAPIKVEKEVVGVLIARRDGTSLSQITDQMGFGKKGYAYIMGTDGTLYAHPEKDNVLKQRSIFKDIQNNGEFKEWGQAIKELGVGNEGVVKYELAGSKRYFGIVPMRSTGWIVGVGAYESDVLSRLKNLKNIIIIGSVIFLLVGISVAIMLGKSISKPMVVLSNIIERFSRFDISVDENSEVMKYIKRKDEIVQFLNQY